MAGEKKLNLNWEELMKEGHESYLKGCHRTANEYYKNAAELAAKSDALNHSQISELYILHGDLCFEDNKFSEAGKSYAQALASLNTNAGMQDVDKALVLKKTSEICRVMGKEDEAIRFAHLAHRTIAAQRRRLENLYKESVSITSDR